MIKVFLVLILGTGPTAQTTALAEVFHGEAACMAMAKLLNDEAKRRNVQGIARFGCEGVEVVDE